ncbi:MAG: hypothetical protein ACOWWM_20140 [Desulfobacterales bacterium]
MSMIVAGCSFCSPAVDDRIMARLGSVFAIRNAPPVTESHMLILPFRHADDCFSLDDTEKRDTD